MTDKTTIEPDMTENSNDNRQQQLEHWLQQVFAGQDFKLDSLPGDASSRQYHRLQWLNQSDSDEAEHYIVMDSADEQQAMQQFINVTALMAPAINVPTLIAQDMEQGFLVLQDFGTVEFAHLLVGATPAQVDAYYQAAKIDGASNWSVFRFIQLPKMKNVLTIAILLRFMVPKASPTLKSTT